MKQRPGVRHFGLSAQPRGVRRATFAWWLAAAAFGWLVVGGVVWLVGLAQMSEWSIRTWAGLGLGLSLVVMAVWPTPRGPR